MVSLKFTLYCNSALLQNKSGNFREADENASRALELEGLSDAEKAKAYFRRGVAKVGLKDDDSAVDDLTAASKLAPGDAAITRELEAAKTRIQTKKEKTKAKMKSFFGGGN